MTTTAIPGHPTGKRLKKVWGIGILILLTGVVGGIVWLVKTRTPALLTVASRVTTQGKYSGNDFAWISENEYLCVSTDGQTILRYRLSDGVRTPLTSPVDNLSQVANIEVSPNGEWVCWDKLTYANASFRSGIYNGSIRSYPYLSHLSDTHHRQLSGMAGGRWEPDSSHLFSFGTLVVMSDKNRLTVQPTVFFSDGFEGGDSLNVPIEPAVVSELNETIMVTPNRLLGISQQDGPHKGPAELNEYKLDKTLHRTRTWLVKLPPHTMAWEGKIAPAGDRVAWLITTEYVDPALAALHRLLPPVKTYAQSRQELWISRLDGTGMQVLGQTPIGMKNGNQVSVADLRWLPDGRHLSFVYDDALWRVSTSR